jgi:predicted RNA-binding protein with PUA-like domain
MTAYWLLKTEPESWSWDMQVKAGKAGTEWTGVRNFTAQRNMREMKKGDLAFFYHTGDEKQIVGIVTVVKEAHPETGAEDWQAVDVAATKAMPSPVTLAAVKADKKLAGMALVKYARLSVQSVTEAEWKHIAKLGGL